MEREKIDRINELGRIAKTRELTPEEHVKHYEELGYGRMDAIKAAAKDRKVPKNEIYKEVLDLKA